MRSNWTKPLAIMLSVTVLTGCATSKEDLLPH
ncbi:TIGR03751 family conjugal transfer lipoprotein, partial [Pectobacterium parmentieri]|nr:TIGR03751 family conjugal transfer lipoprotein [Pectobacterium parmentieri]MBI0570811.1 TIGR03751 family conjugal transfer lipoprotein [Pectobacterium parmentieri]MBI0575536.1 TIGR03751 family conjugal transfer lipoprotein [Pectobacterium parmentieri]